MRRYAFIALAVLTFVWGYNWVVMKIAVQYAPPIEFAAYRLLGGGILLFAIMIAMRRPLRPKYLRRFILIGVFQSGGFVALAMWAVLAAGAGKVAVLSYTMPFWVAILAWPIFGERLQKRQMVSIAIAMCGILLIMDFWHAKGSLVADGIAVAAGVSWAIGVILAKRLQMRYEVDVLELTTWQLIFGGIAVGIVALIVPEHATHWTPVYIGTLLYNIIAATALGYLLFIFVLRHLTAREASMGTLLNPILGIVAAWLQLGEAPSTTEAFGMGLVVLSLAALTLEQKRVPDNE